MSTDRKGPWTPSPDDAINLSTLRWYALTIERLLIEIYSTDRKKLPGLQKLLNEQLKKLYEYSQSQQLTSDEDDCPPGQILCPDGLCAPSCDPFES